MNTPVEWRDLIEGILTEETRVPVSYGEVILYTVSADGQLAKVLGVA